MYFIKKLFGLTSAQLQISDVIEITNPNPDIRIQETRKRNLQLAITVIYGGNVLNFANALNKNILFIKGLLIPVEKRISRPITDTTARLLEANLRIKSGTLDIENHPDFSQNYIPYISVSKSFASNCLSYDSTKESVYYEHPEYKTQHLILLDTSNLRQLTIQTDNNKFESYHHDVLGKILIINRATGKIITMYDKEKLEFNGEIIDTLTKRENHD